MPSEFNLLDEPWILAITPDGTIKELSLVQTLKEAHQLQALAGELPTQDFAVMRLLLAYLHTVLSRTMLEDMNKAENGKKFCLGKWEEMWQRRQFEPGPIEDYAARWHGRFYLFDEVRPFYQVPALGDETVKATDYQGGKLNGEISESSNKIRLFSPRQKFFKNTMTYPEAARWLLHLNGFDDTSAKPMQKGLPSPGAGWLGKLGIVCAKGNNLFETLMLNLVLLNDEEVPWGPAHPSWERETPKENERTQIAPPDNLAECYTLQSRRLFLLREDDHVKGYRLLGGDFFPKENMFVEPMTMWVLNKDKDYVPRRHDPAQQIWREMAPLLGYGEGEKKPGIVRWINLLEGKELLETSKVCLKTVTAKYADKDFFLADVAEDEVVLDAAFMEGSKQSWIPTIIEQVEITDALAKRVGWLASDLVHARAACEDKKNHLDRDAEERAREELYYRLDRPFRQWLLDAGSKYEEQSQAKDAWFEEAHRRTLEYGRELVLRSGSKAMTGRTAQTEDRTGTAIKNIYAAPLAYDRFVKNIANSEQLRKGGKK